jgi:hypothetical protein
VVIRAWRRKVPEASMLDVTVLNRLIGMPDPSSPIDGVDAELLVQAGYVISGAKVHVGITGIIAVTEDGIRPLLVVLKPAICRPAGWLGVGTRTV